MNRYDWMGIGLGSVLSFIMLHFGMGIEPQVAVVIILCMTAILVLGYVGWIQRKRF